MDKYLLFINKYLLLLSRILKLDKMELKITTKQILRILLILSWIIFIGLCIEAGAFIVNAFFVIANPAVSAHLWRQVDLSALFKYDQGHFFAVIILMTIVAVLKACLFFLIITILHDKDLDMTRPFSKKVGRFILNVSYLALGIGLFSWWGVKYAGWLVKQAVVMPEAESLRLGGADVWLFMSVTLFVIAQIFKRGIEIQTENELTV
jgi:hypothetical protein